MPDEVVLRCGLASGLELDRPLLRRIRRELRSAEALALAGRALARRDLSARRLEERLERAKVRRPVATGAVRRLAEARVVDDARVARGRATSLAARGWGDAAILGRLERDGIDEAVAREALADLPAEGERAARLVAPEGDRRRAAALLVRRGFSVDAIEHAVGGLDDGL